MRQPPHPEPATVQADPAELAEWCDAFDGLLSAYGSAQGKEQAAALLDAVLEAPPGRYVVPSEQLLD